MDPKQFSQLVGNFASSNSQVSDDLRSKLSKIRLDLEKPGVTSDEVRKQLPRFFSAIASSDYRISDEVKSQFLEISLNLEKDEAALEKSKNEMKNSNQAEKKKPANSIDTDEIMDRPAIIVEKSLEILPSTAAKSISTEKISTFAAITTSGIRVDASKLAKPIVEGNQTIINIDEEIYNKHLENFKNNLLGRILLNKGVKPIRVDELHVQLTRIWKPLSKWSLTPVGKGFYDIHFESGDDMNDIKIMGSVNLEDNVGYFRTFNWKSDFNPMEEIKLTHVRTWVRFFGLSQDYWDHRLLLQIAKGTGNPISLDDSTRLRKNGLFARVLVEVDLEKLPTELTIRKKNKSFNIQVYYERIPYKCHTCKKWGHETSQCWKNKDTKKPVEVVEESEPVKPVELKEVTESGDSAVRTINSDKVTLITEDANLVGDIVFAANEDLNMVNSANIMLKQDILPSEIVKSAKDKRQVESTPKSAKTSTSANRFSVLSEVTNECVETSTLQHIDSVTMRKKKVEPRDPLPKRERKSAYAR